jgi:hypothetical protein
MPISEAIDTYNREMCVSGVVYTLIQSFFLRRDEECFEEPTKETYPIDAGWCY